MKKITMFLTLFLVSIGMMAQSSWEKAVNVHLYLDKQSHQAVTEIKNLQGEILEGASAIFSTNAQPSVEPLPLQDTLYLSNVTSNQKAEYLSEMAVTLPYALKLGEIKLRLHGCWGKKYAPNSCFIKAVVTLNDGVKDLASVTKNELQINGAGGLLVPFTFDKNYEFQAGQAIKVRISLTGLDKGVNVLYGYNMIYFDPIMTEMDKIEQYLAANPANSIEYGKSRNFVLYEKALASHPKTFADFKNYLDVHKMDLYETEFYSIRNSNLHFGLDGHGKLVTSKNKNSFLSPVSPDKLNTLFKIVPAPTKGRYYLEHLNTGLRLTLNGYDQPCTWTTEGSLLHFPKCFPKQPENSYMCLQDAAATANVYWNEGTQQLIFSKKWKNGSSMWVLENYKSINLHLVGTKDNSAWSSVYLPFDAKVIDGQNVIAYGVSNVAEKTVTLTDMDGVQARQGALLKAPTAGLYTFLIGDYAKVKQPDFKNLLSGTTIEQDVAAEHQNQYYVLGMNSDKVIGLYGSNSTVMKANKAYLALPKGAAVQGLKFSFDDVTTGVDEIEVNAPTEETESVYYDLSGRRVMHPTHGIYIKNGKKVYFK